MDFKEFLTVSEGATVRDGRVSFDYGSGEGMSTRLGKGKRFTPFRKTTDRTVVYSVYDVKDAVDTLKAVKAAGREPDDAYRGFINRTAVFISGRIVRPSGVEAVITPASSSTIVRDTVAELRRRHPEVEFVTERFRKLDPGSIRIAEDDPRITPGIVKALRRVLDNAARDGYFQMKKVNAKDRKFLSNFFELVDGYRYEKLEGRRVAILDDLIRTGTSFDDMTRVLEKYAPESVVGITLFKSST